uniref:Nudix hydrolase domain-containing protein n=1 Tax=Tetranychus urticae TaxID=32264 RepID=T1JYC1_TETUR
MFTVVSYFGKSSEVKQFGLYYFITPTTLTEAFQRLEKIGANLRSRSNQGNKKDGDSNLRRASVFVPFCRDQDHKPSILVTLRSSNLVTHKWEVSFPGGKESRKDGGDVIETAVRETIEELGIDRNSLKTYGVLKPIIRPKHNSSIYPVLGYLDYDFSRQNLTDFNSSEVEKVILIPLEKACKAEYWNYTHWKSGWVTPIYHDDICNGRQIPRIWGLTASLMSMILKIVLPQHFKGCKSEGKNRPRAIDNGQ